MPVKIKEEEKGQIEQEDVRNEIEKRKGKELLKLPTISQVLQMEHPDLIAFLKKICHLHSPKFWFLRSSVKNAVTLVAHIDTVHEKWNYRTGKWDETKREYIYDPPKPRNMRLFFDQKEQVFWSPDGLGADDRAGVYGILRVYAAMPPELKPNLLFCDEEESGGKGAKDAADGLPELGNSLFFVELDRRRGKDCVFYNSEPGDFVEYIESFGFKKDVGSFSDVSTLGSRFKLCATNLSVGFYDEHTKHERLECKKLAKTINKTCQIVADGITKGKRWPNNPPPIQIQHYGGGGIHGYVDADGTWVDTSGCRNNNHLRRLFPTIDEMKAKYSKEELKRHPYLEEYLEERRKLFI